MVMLWFYTIVIIYVMFQILKRWGKMSKHETFTALMNAGMAWGAIVAVLVFFTTESYRLMVGGLFTIGFWSISIIYFYWDYKKSHKKSEPSIPDISVSYHPLTPETVEPTKPITASRRKIIFIKNLLFTILEVIEALYCLNLIRDWIVVTVPIGKNNIPILTYQNGALIVSFIIGVILMLDVARRLHHPKETFFAE